MSEPFAAPVAGEIHLHWLPYVEHPAVEEAAKHALNESECERAARYKATSARSSFIYYRWALRVCLGYYLQVEPSAVPLQVGEFGKPYLAAMGSVNSPLEFNLSHTTQRGLLAVSGDSLVGVDLEQRDTGVNYASLAVECMSQAEYLNLRGLPAAAVPAAVLGCWTRKEALLKGLAKGLAISPTNVTMKELPSGEWEVLFFEDSLNVSDWRVRSWSPRVDEFVAVAYQHTAPPRLLEFSAEPYLRSLLEEFDS